MPDCNCSLQPNFITDYLQKTSAAEKFATPADHSLVLNEAQTPSIQSNNADFLVLKMHLLGFAPANARGCKRVRDEHNRDDHKPRDGGLGFKERPVIRLRVAIDAAH